MRFQTESREDNLPNLCLGLLAFAVAEARKSTLKSREDFWDLDTASYKQYHLHTPKKDLTNTEAEIFSTSIFWPLATNTQKNHDWVGR